ncbi:peroxiredoxin-like bacterioferritin comigratory protein [Methanocella arvoryzae MRE50]|uniref:Peroxiredoxin-like bacterioferritin comigratory protein n=2 Tax=Methanocella TaxID=570266 RepID=Q0W5B4_METAR|nr:peroxiredoxin-like bacterioferritin comigratory protein [Methanocella arvoryzae MRE50]
MILRLDVGSRAEDARLKNADGKDVSLSDYIGRSNLVMIFFLGGFDLHSMRSLRDFIDRYQDLRELGADVIAITPELPGKVKTITENLKPPFTLLSDPELDSVRKYDVYNPTTNWTWPAAFIIDKDGVIQYAYRGASPPNVPDLGYITMKLRQMAGAK